MRQELKVLAILAVLLAATILAPAAANAQAQLYEITWQSSGFNHQTDPGWNLSGSGYAILGPIQPHERSTEFSSATHVLIFTWDRRAWGGQLPGPDGPFQPPAPAGSPSLVCSTSACGGSLTMSGDAFTATWAAGGHIVNVDFRASGRRITSPPAATTQYAFKWLSFTESASLVGTGVGTLEGFPPLPGQPNEPVYRLTVADQSGGAPRALATIIGEGDAVRTERLPVALSSVSGALGGGSFMPSPGTAGSSADGPSYFVVDLWGLGIGADGSSHWTQFVGHGQRSEAASLAASISSPAEGASVSGTVTVGMAASGASGGPSTFALAVDGSVVSTQTLNGSSASYSWNTATVAAGSHTLRLTVTDGLGRSATATRGVDVTNATPSLKVALTSPKAGAVVSGTVAVNIWVDGAAAGTKTFTLAVDGTVIATQNCACVHVWPGWNTKLVGNGARTLTATVRDSAGRTGTVSISVTVSN